MKELVKRRSTERGKAMATTTLAPTLNTPLSDLRPATMDRILVIADDSALRNALHRLFSLERYEVEVVTDSVTGLARLRERPFSAVILDLQRPGSSGWDLCRNIADSISGLPLVVLSANPDVADKVLLLEMGADDCLTIPFSAKELVARLRALMRRASRISQESLYIFEDLIVDFSKIEVTRGGEKDKEPRARDLARRTSQ
jgi:DNA-binding response OmpR family regulator